jgi:hypothetical protein
MQQRLERANGCLCDRVDRVVPIPCADALQGLAITLEVPEHGLLAGSPTTGTEDGDAAIPAGRARRSC